MSSDIKWVLDGSDTKTEYPYQIAKNSISFNVTRLSFVVSPTLIFKFFSNSLRIKLEPLNQHEVVVHTCIQLLPTFFKLNM